MVAACGEPPALRGRGQGGTSAFSRDQGMVCVAVVLVARLPGWRRGGLCEVVAVRHCVLSAIGPQLPWAGSVGRPRLLVRRLGHDAGTDDREEHSPGGGRGGGRGCSVLGRCFSSDMRCWQCAVLCFSLVLVLCGLTRSAFSGTAVDTHVLSFVSATGVERGALRAVCDVSELYPAPPLVSAKYPLISVALRASLRAASASAFIWLPSWFHHSPRSGASSRSGVGSLASFPFALIEAGPQDRLSGSVVLISLGSIRSGVLSSMCGAARRPHGSLPKTCRQFVRALSTEGRRP